MSYQVIYRDVSDGVFVSLRQTGYASIHIRRTAAARSSTLIRELALICSYVSINGVVLVDPVANVQVIAVGKAPGSPVLPLTI
jgi:hypothetical protein